MTGESPIAPRGELPPGSEPYRTIGPFDAASLPQGLRTEHDLKQGVWAVLALEQGAIGFVWDDAAGGRDELTAPAALVIPPRVPHHVDADGAFELTITFHRARRRAINWRARSPLPREWQKNPHCSREPDK